MNVTSICKMFVNEQIETPDLSIARAGAYVFIVKEEKFLQKNGDLEKCASEYDKYV